MGIGVERRCPGLPAAVRSLGNAGGACAQLGSRLFGATTASATSLSGRCVRAPAARPRRRPSRRCWRGPSPPPARRCPPRPAAAPARPAQRALPGLSAPAGHGRVLEFEDASGRAVLACAVAFAGRVPTVRSLRARAPGRLTETNARFWAARWKRLLPPPADARAARAPARPRSRPLARVAREHRRAQALTRRPARQDRWADCDDAAGRRRRSRQRVRRAHPPDRALADPPEHLYSATGLALASSGAHESLPDEPAEPGPHDARKVRDRRSRRSHLRPFTLDRQGESWCPRSALGRRSSAKRVSACARRHGARGG